MNGDIAMFSRFFLFGLFVSAFCMAGVGAEVIVADFTENDLKGYMSWNNFLDNCVEGGTPYGGGTEFDSINVHLEIDTDKETLVGTLSGGGRDDQYDHLYIQECSFVGTISGTAKRVYWAGYQWQWELKADVELDLSFSTSYRCLDDSTGEYYWKSREETVHITRVLTAPTSSDNNQEFMYFIINWGTPEQQATPQTFFMTEKNDDERGRAILPLEMPDAVDLEVMVGGPEQIGRGDSGATFDLEVKGEDSDRVQKVHWYFYYFDEGFDEYRWFESFEREDLSDLAMDSSKIEDWMEYLDNYGKTVDGVKVLPMQLYVELEAGESEWLEVSKLFNFTLSSAHSCRFTLVVPEEMDVYPTGKNSTSFNVDYSGTEVTSAITFEIEGSPPAYLSIALEKTSAQKASNGITENKITVELDTSKLAGTSLPTEYTLHIKAKSTTKEGTVEDSNGITLHIKPVKWLILHYIASDTVPPLQVDDEKNLEEIFYAFLGTNTPQIGYNLLLDLEKDWNSIYFIYADSLPGGSTHLAKKFDNQIECIESTDSLDMSKRATLTDFIKKAKEITPYEKVILIITDHGYGVNGVILDRHKGIADHTVMSILELDKALEGNNVDLLVFEACEMGDLEVLYEVRDKADYIVASQLPLFGFSFNYGEALKPLLKKPSLSPGDVGKLFLDAYSLPDSPIDYSITLIDTSKLDNLVQEVKGLSSAMVKGSSDTETWNMLLKVLEVKSNDLKCLAENILKLGISDNDIKTAAEKVKNAVDAAVIANKYYITEGKIAFSEGIRGFVLIEDEEAKIQTGDKVVDLGKYTYSGIDITKNKYLLTRDFNTKYEAFEFNKKASWLDVLKKYSSAKKSKIIVKKTQKGNNLYLRTVDPEGCVNGFDPQSEYRNRIVLDYFQAEYYSYLNGTEVILLPPEPTEFNTLVYGGYMEEPEESYTLTYRLIIDDVVVAEETQENPITEYTEHSIPITIMDGEITIGETSITQLEIPQEDEPVIDTEEQDTDQGSGGGIPSFPLVSIILGITLSLFLYRKRM